MFMASRHKARKSIAVLLVALIAGCNGASGDGTTSSGNYESEPTPPNADSQVLSAENKVSASRSMSSSHVLLEGKIHSPSNEGANVVSLVEPVTELESCQDIVFDSKGYTASFDDFVGVCVYKYNAENSTLSGQQASAYSISVVQKNVDSEVATFSPISETTLVGETLVIDLKSEPGFLAEVPEGYKMSGDLNLIGDGEATADATNQTITYNPTQEGGFAKIIYSYSDGNEVKLGSVAVAVSSSTNAAPIAPNIDYSNQPNAQTVNIDESVIIDLSDYVSDPDGNPLQLISTESWNASVSPTNPQDMNNLELTFRTLKVGEHFVSYVVSDHYGGYATGTIRIEVYDPATASTWGNLNLDMEYYSAPLVKSEADAQNLEYTSSHIDEGVGRANVVTMNVTQAIALCNATGRLPTVDELKSLSNISGGLGPASYGGWPVEIDYWAYDNGNATPVSLSSGEPNNVVNTSGQYVTCISVGGYIIDTQHSKLTAISDGQDQATVRVRATLNGQPIQGIEVEAQVSGQAQVNNAPITDVNGEATFEVIDTKAETVTFTTNIPNNGSERTATLNFTGNPNTAQLSLINITDHQHVTGTNVFQAKLTDETNAPLVGQSITYSTTDPVELTPDNQVTNDSGVQTVRVTASNPNTNSPIPYTVEGSYTRPDSSIAIANISMQFETNILDKTLMSTRDGQGTYQTNEVTAKFDALSYVSTDDRVTFSIQGNAVFVANNSQEISVLPNLVTGTATAEIKAAQPYPAAPNWVTYSVKANYFDQETNELTQHFVTGGVNKNSGVYYQFEPEGNMLFREIPAHCRSKGLQPVTNFTNEQFSVTEMEAAGWRVKTPSPFTGSNAWGVSEVWSVDSGDDNYNGTLDLYHSYFSGIGGNINGTSMYLKSTIGFKYWYDTEDSINQNSVVRYSGHTYICIDPK